MIRDVTTTWQTDPAHTALYIVRCTKPGWSDRLRIGATGLKAREKGLQKRLRDHSMPFTKQPDTETDKLKPFGQVVQAWALDGWTSRETLEGEWCLWRALLTRFPKHSGGKNKDRSIFVVPVHIDLSDVIKEVEADLRSLELVRAVPSTEVSVPHEANPGRGPRMTKAIRAFLRANPAAADELRLQKHKIE